MAAAVQIAQQIQSVAGLVEVVGISGDWPGMVKPRAYCPTDQNACEADAGRVDVEHVLRGFRDMLVAAGRSKGTQRVYVCLVRRWLLGGGAPGHLDSELFARWLRGYRERVSAAQVNGVIKACRAFYRAQALCSHCAPGEDLKLPAMRHLPPRAVRHFTLEQVADVLAAPDVDSWIGFRDHVLMRVLFETGVRASELVNVSMGDVLADGTVFVRRGRGVPDRYVPISQDLQALLAHWLARRREVRPGKRLVLFVGRHGRGLSARTVWAIVDRHSRASLGRAMGIAQLARAGKPWSGHYPHLLRATIAVTWHARGMPLTAIASLLGHASITTTARYVAVDIEQLRAAIARHPRNRLAVPPR